MEAMYGYKIDFDICGSFQIPFAHRHPASISSTELSKVSIGEGRVGIVYILQLDTCY